jgi:hypothetical protein
VVFDKGLSHDFKTMVLSAAFLVTTSITEGFGFSFLEPWIFGKLLWGRKLPEICRDFEMNGVQLTHLYSGLFVPLEWIDFRRFKKKWITCVLNASERFNFNIDQVRIRTAFDAITKDGTIDFGLLDESSQKKVILQLVSPKNNREKLIRLNPFLSDPGTIPDKNALISENQAVIRQHYNPALYRQRLGEVYHRVNSTAVEHRIDRTVLISEFFNLEKFSLLKWGTYGG